MKRRICYTGEVPEGGVSVFTLGGYLVSWN